MAGSSEILAAARAVARQAVTSAMAGDKAAAVAVIEEFGDPMVMSLALLDVAVLTHQSWAFNAGMNHASMWAEWSRVCADQSAWAEFGPPAVHD